MNMGGGSGGGLFSSDIRSLEDKVKQRLAEAKANVSRHVFISLALLQKWSVQPSGETQ
jgi:hypothetical protein